jgi:hypothetical protein
MAARSLPPPLDDDYDDLGFTKTNPSDGYDDHDDATANDGYAYAYDDDIYGDATTYTDRMRNYNYPWLKDCSNGAAYRDAMCDEDVRKFNSAFRDDAASYYDYVTYIDDEYVATYYESAESKFYDDDKQTHFDAIAYKAHKDAIAYEVR